VTFDVPQVNAEVPDCTTPVQIRTSSTFAEDRGTRVYVNRRALYVPTGIPGSTGTWHISVFALDGTLRWSQRPSATAIENRYTFLHLLTGKVVRDVAYPVPRPSLQ